MGYNSSSHDDPLSKNHYGIIEKEHIDLIEEILRSADLENKLKVFVIHHHVYQYPNPHPKWVDISCLQNSQPLIELLSKYSFNLVIHGHRHVPYFLSTQINNFPTINLFCAGSLSCEVHPEIAGSVGNLFHIFEIDDKIKCKGRVLSKAYHATEYKWIDSKENFGIEYKNPFGCEVSYKEVLALCSKKIEEDLKTRETIEYTSFFDSIPDLMYIHNTTHRELIKELEIKHNLKASTFGDKELIFIKK